MTRSRDMHQKVAAGPGNAMTTADDAHRWSVLRRGSAAYLYRGGAGAVSLPSHADGEPLHNRAVPGPGINGHPA